MKQSESILVRLVKVFTSSRVIRIFSTYNTCTPKGTLKDLTSPPSEPDESITVARQELRRSKRTIEVPYRQGCYIEGAK